MKWIIFILLISLGAGYSINHYVLTNLNQRWYCYFVVNDLKAFLVSVALGVVTWRTKQFVYALAALIVCGFDLLTQILDVNIKGDWADTVYQILIGLLILSMAWQMRKSAG